MREQPLPSSSPRHSQERPISSSTDIRIVIADDHPVVLQGLAALIDCQPGLSIVAQASNGQEAIDRYAEYQPDVALIDLRMPQVDGVNAIAQIRQAFADARIIVLTTYDRDEDIYRGIQAGAMGYLLKDAEPEELLTAIRTVAAGQRWFASTVGVKLAERTHQSDLSERENEVIRLMALGKTNLEIAELLHISESTVKFHVGNLMTKLKVKDRVQAVLIALRRGIASL